MKNKFNYNIFFNDDEKSFQDLMEDILLTYIKQTLDDGDV